MRTVNTLSRPKFGQQVTVKAKAVRVEDYDLRPRYNQRLKRWERREFKAPRGARYIGFRTKFNGETEWIDQVGEVFTPTSHFELWLVVENERTNPYAVWPDDCEVQP